MKNKEKLDKNTNSKEDIIKEIGEIKLKTAEKFTKLLISNLKNYLNKKSKPSFIELIEFERIKNLFEKENRRNMIKNYVKTPEKEQKYVFKITLAKGIWRIIEIKGSMLLSRFSNIIQDSFGHEPGHLHEFELNKYKFGPECDEWEETFDNLDNIRLDSALNAIGFKVGVRGKFKYDFGEDMKHILELIEIKELEEGVKYLKIEGNKEIYKCENCSTQDAVFYCHGCENRLCEDCSKNTLKDSNSCTEGHYPLLSVFQGSKSYWT
ncbi:MAG: hypothetical protein AABX85_00650 [Nanoarchaeota archaeon]